MTTLGYRELWDGVPHLVFHRQFRAPIADVWAAITEPDRLARWFGTWSGDPATGRVRVQWTAEEDAAAEEYVIDACEPPNHLRVHNDNPDPTQVWVLDLRLSEAGGVTTLVFAQLVDANVPVTDVGPGWQYYLDRLDVAFAGGDAGTVTWDGYLDHGPHYAREFDLPD